MGTVTFGDGNSGLQAGTINGPVSAQFHYPGPQRPETPPNPSILIPFGRDRDFVERRNARGNILDQIDRSCVRAGSRTALVGLGGVGKSQLAIEYAHRIRAQSFQTWVFWIHASNATRFEEGFRDLATCVKIPRRQDPKVNIYELVRDWLRNGSKGRWVIVLDNVDDPTFLKGYPDVGAATPTTKRQLISYIPYCQHGSVLITSRNKAAALQLVEHADIITIKPMNQEDALQLFQNKLGQIGDETCTVELAVALEYMPLAIVQAAAYILQRRPGYSLREYLDEFRSDRKKVRLLSREGGELRRDEEAKNSILITWRISFEYIHANSPSASDMLSLMSFCDRQGIPKFLLRGQSDQTQGDGAQNQSGQTSDLGVRDENMPDTQNDHGIGDGSGNAYDSDSDSDSNSGSTDQQSYHSDVDRFEDDILTLKNFSFIVANQDGTAFEMHRLIQLATLEWLRSHDTYEQWRNHFLIRLREEMPGGEYENWSKCQALFPHARSISVQRPAAMEALENWATILYQAAWYALRKGKGVEAESLSYRAMKARKKIFKKDHEEVVWSKALVASVYASRGRWSEAETLQAQVMETRKTKLGADHPSTMISMGNLASTYRHQGRWDDAEKLEVRVVEISKTKLGVDHRNTLASMANLASTYRQQGRWEEAETLDVHVIETFKTKLGVDHANTLTSMANLAATFWMQGRYEEAERLGVQVMETRKTILGADHPDTLISIDNLATTFSSQGRYEEAERLSVQVMETFKTKLGVDHHDTLTSMHNLALTFLMQGRYEEAERLGVQVMETRKTKLGPDHPDTLTSMHNLAYAFASLGRPDEALDLMARCVFLRQRVLGLQHPETRSSRESIELWQHGDI